jgi:hypothetical protein
MIQFQLGTSGTTSATGSPTASNQFSQYLLGSTIGAEKQFKNNLFLSVNTGLCQFSSNAPPVTLSTLLGAKVEYRFLPTLSTQVAYDPPSYGRAGACGATQGIIGFVPTPGQFSLGFFHTWRF